ncbi:MAG: fibronectin type III domain-containing protein [Gammaproteobacteria bacterium]|jgi:hypothetical protein
MWPALLALLCCLLVPPVIQARPPVPRLQSDTEIATAGYFRLSWETVAAGVELQESTGADFRDPHTAYLGPDRATVISGKPDGIWYYRIRARDEQQAGAWSTPVQVTVAHHGLHRALVFFGLGVLVFLATIALITRGTGPAR